MSRVRRLAEPVEVARGCWVWAMGIPWFPDLLAAPSLSLTQSPIREAFGRQITLLRAVAAGSPPGTALQLRFVGGIEGRQQVHCFLVGRATSREAAIELCRLVTGGMPPEFPLEPLTDHTWSVAVQPIDTDNLSTSNVAEIRRAIEALDPALGRHRAELDPVLVPWTWSAQALLSSLHLLRQQQLPASIIVHAERVAFPAEVGLYLQREISRYEGLLQHNEENPLALVGRRAYREWLLELPHAALHLRVVIAADEPLAPGVADMLGADLTRTWEEAGPMSLLGMFDVVRPESPVEIDNYALLVEELRSQPIRLPADPDLARLLHLFEPSEANMVFRFPITPRGGVEGIATARPTTIGRGIDATTVLEPGTLYLGESPASGAAGLRLSDINQHLLVAGLPGFGKSVTVQSLLERLTTEHQIPFLVIDPAKSDYRELAGRLATRNIATSVYALHGGTAAFNPLAVPDGSTATDHGGRVMAAFDTAFQLNQRWPAAYMVLARALFEVYDEWVGRDDWPTLNDLYRATASTIDQAGYRKDTAAELRAGLLGRLEYLVHGPLGRALSGGGDAAIDWARIVTEPTIIELRRFPGPEERALVFGFLMAGLVSYREANPYVGGLRHVTVLEEAHRVLGGRAAGTIGVQLFTEAIAELRGAGEGFIVVDQAPSLLDPGISRCTGSKLAHRLVDAAERRTFGEAMVLDQTQQEDLARLGPGRAIVYAASSSLPVVIDVAATGTPVAAIPPPEDRMAAAGGGEALWCMDCPVRCHGRGGLSLRDELAARMAMSPPDANGQGTARLVSSAVGVLAAERDSTSLAEAYCLSASVLGTQSLSAAVLRRRLGEVTAEVVERRRAQRPAMTEEERV